MSTKKSPPINNSSPSSMKHSSSPRNTKSCVARRKARRPRRPTMRLCLSSRVGAYKTTSPTSLPLCKPLLKYARSILDSKCCQSVRIETDASGVVIIWWVRTLDELVATSHLLGAGITFKQYPTIRIQKTLPGEYLATVTFSWLTMDIGSFNVTLQEQTAGQ